MFRLQKGGSWGFVENWLWLIGLMVTAVCSCVLYSGTHCCDAAELLLVCVLLCESEPLFSLSVSFAAQTHWSWSGSLCSFSLRLLSRSCDGDHALCLTTNGSSLMLDARSGWTCAVGTRTGRRRSVRTAHGELTCCSALGPTVGAGLRTPFSCSPGCSTSTLPSPGSAYSSPCCLHIGSLRATSYPSTAWTDHHRTTGSEVYR